MLLCWARQVAIFFSSPRVEPQEDHGECSTSLQLLAQQLKMAQAILPSKKTALSWTAIFSALLLGLWTRSGERTSSSVKDIFSFGANEEYVCQDQQYTTEIISVDPLMIYINDFVSREEARDLVAVG